MIRYTRHALERMRQRGISIREIDSLSEAVLIRDSIQNETGDFQFKKKGSSSALIVVFRIDNQDIIVITCYRTKLK